MNFSTRSIRMSAIGLLSVLFVLTSGIGAARALAPASNHSPSAPELIAVKFHADWCGSCKAIGSRFIDLRNKFDDQPVLFVKLDFTNASDRVQSEYLSAAMGFDAIWEQYGNTTGFILLIDADSKEILDTLGPADDFKEMKSRLTQAIASAK